MEEFLEVEKEHRNLSKKDLLKFNYLNFPKDSNCKCNANTFSGNLRCSVCELLFAMNNFEIFQSIPLVFKNKISEENILISVIESNSFYFQVNWFAESLNKNIIRVKFPFFCGKDCYEFTKIPETKNIAQLTFFRSDQVKFFILQILELVDSLSSVSYIAPNAIKNNRIIISSEEGKIDRIKSRISLFFNLPPHSVLKINNEWILPSDPIINTKNHIENEDDCFKILSNTTHCLMEQNEEIIKTYNFYYFLTSLLRNDKIRTACLDDDRLTKIIRIVYLFEDDCNLEMEMIRFPSLLSLSNLWMEKNVMNKVKREILK